jgi:hypothetical protein
MPTDLHDTANAVRTRVREEKRQQLAIQQAVRQLIRYYKKSGSLADRRRHDRADFIQTVKVRFEDGRELTLLSRDLSTNGIRLIGTQSLLGQKLRVSLPLCDGEEPCCFQVRILWTCRVGDGLFENGGTFVRRLESQSERQANRA